ncbi:hypothetical protein [Caballeronia sp. KNU42]
MDIACGHRRHRAPTLSEAESEAIARRGTCRAVPVRDARPSYIRLSYIRLSDIPPPWQDAFRAALRGSAAPLIEGEDDCAWAWDWTDWLQGRFPYG